MFPASCHVSSTGNGRSQVSRAPLPGYFQQYSPYLIPSVPTAVGLGILEAIPLPSPSEYSSFDLVSQICLGLFQAIDTVTSMTSYGSSLQLSAPKVSCHLFFLLSWVCAYFTPSRASVWCWIPGKLQQHCEHRAITAHSFFQPQVIYWTKLVPAPISRTAHCWLFLTLCHSATSFHCMK